MNSPAQVELASPGAVLLMKAAVAGRGGPSARGGRVGHPFHIPLRHAEGGSSMRLFSRSGGRHQRPTGTTTPGVYRSASYAPLRPWQVRRRRFRPAGLLRRGLDPADVQEFMTRVADDLAAVYDRLRQSEEEAYLIKEALRRWQSEHGPRVVKGAYR